MSNINVAIADDNERIRHNLKDMVSREKDMTIVGSASDGVDAVSMIRRTHPGKRASGALLLPFPMTSRKCWKIRTSGKW